MDLLQKSQDNLKTSYYEVGIIFRNEVLGSKSQTDIGVKHVRQKSEKAILKELGKPMPESDKLDRLVDYNKFKDEVDQKVEELDEDSVTVFVRNTKNELIFRSYVLKGFLKATASKMNGKILDVKNAKSLMNNHVTIRPEEIPIIFPEGKTVEDISVSARPLLAQTPMGPRSAIARSEMVPAGCGFRAMIQVTDPSKLSEAYLREILEQGHSDGISQWHNSGEYGIFDYTLRRIPDEEVEIAQSFFELSPEDKEKALSALERIPSLMETKMKEMNFVPKKKKAKKKAKKEEVIEAEVMAT